jgi:tetratricopeptide (TPR) repeat protein
MGGAVNLFEGLYLYEVVLLVLGVILFLALIFSLLYQVLHKRKFTSLLGFFMLPIAMIGYPSIKSIQYSDGAITLEKTTQELQAKPTDPAARQALQDQVTQMAARPASSARILTVLAQAQYALGNEASASGNLGKALQSDPNAVEARQLQHKIELIKNLNRMSSEIETHPANLEAKADLQKSLKEASELKVANPDALVQVARAQTVLGDHQKALETAQKVLAINPNSAPALLLQKTIRGRIGNAVTPSAPH